jgi:hypothetical protein
MKTRNHFKIPLALGVFAAVVLTLSVLPGCGGGTTLRQNNQSSVGQQLQDLDKAYKDGVITQKDYEKLKKKIIKEND